MVLPIFGGSFLVLSLAFKAAALVARVVAKRNLARDACCPASARRACSALSGLPLLACATVGGSEGLRLKTSIPIPADVPTACYGRAVIKFAGTHKEYDQINPETV